MTTRQGGRLICLLKSKTHPEAATSTSADLRECASLRAGSSRTSSSAMEAIEGVLRPPGEESDVFLNGAPLTDDIFEERGGSSERGRSVPCRSSPHPPGNGGRCRA